VLADHQRGEDRRVVLGRGVGAVAGGCVESGTQVGH
jgi:hypothetical protein